jgi:alpha-amylase
MQREAMARVHAIEKQVIAANDPELTHAWAKMQTSNHFHWMSTKGDADGSNHSPLIPYPSPAEAHARFMNVLDAIQQKLPLPKSA